MAVSGISNGKIRGKFLTRYIFEENEVDMEESARIKAFCGKIGWWGRRGPLAIIQIRQE